MGPRGGLSMGRGVTIPGGLGLTGVIIFLLIQVLSSGSSGAYSVDDPFGQAPQAPGPRATQGIPASQDPERDLKEFSTYVFSSTLDTWKRIFRQEGKPFERAKVVLYRDAVVHRVRRRVVRRRPVLLPAPTSASTSTSASTTTWRPSSARRATSPGRT